MRLGLLAICLLLTLFISACSIGSSSSGEVNYRTGSRALDMQLTGNQPEVFEGDSLSLLLELRNVGTGDIESGLLVVKGYDPTYLPNLRIEPSSRLNIEGKSDYDPYGQLTQIVEIVEPSVRAPRFKEILPQRLNIVACYPYVSEGSYEVCVDPDPFNRQIGNKVCNYQEVSPGAQGHPVAVTSIDPKVSKNDLRFTLRIANVGDGTIYNRRLSPEACAYDLETQDTNLVDVRRVELSGKPLRCEPQNPVRLINGEALVSCVCEGCVDTDLGAYKTVLNVELMYGYRNDLQTSISILAE